MWGFGLAEGDNISNHQVMISNKCLHEWMCLLGGCHD